MLRLVAVLGSAALVATACGNGDNGGDGGGDGGTGGVTGSVEILDALTGDVDVAGIDAAIAAFEAANPGIDVTREGSSDFEQLARSRVEGGNPPDIILHPQPGLLIDFISQGVVQPLDFLDAAALQDQLVPGLVDIGTFDDVFYALQVRLALKSLVWYQPANFAAQGFEVPTTWTELQALTDEIASRGVTPWCIGIESSTATGWVMTDWVEDLMLRVHGQDAYDRWVLNDLKFNSPEVIEVFEDFIEPIWFGENTVFGGRPNILQTNFGDSILGVLNDEDGSHDCYMHRQASFITGFMPEGTTVGPDGDVNFFYLPPTGDQSPALIAGDLAALYTDNDAAREFLRFMATIESSEAWGANGAYLSPFADFDGSIYPDDSLAAQAEIIANADFARFDGSDLMPGRVGTGAFWTEMVEYINNTKQLADALQAIDDAFESS